MSSTRVLDLLRSLSPEAVSRFALAAAEPLARAAEGGPTESAMQRAMGARWEGSMVSLLTRARAATTDGERRDLVGVLGKIERAAGRHRTELRDARLVERAAYVAAHALGVLLHRRVHDVASIAGDVPLGAIRQFILDGQYGLPAPGAPPVLIPGTAFAEADGHPWMIAERDRHARMADALARDVDDPLAIPSRFGEEARALR